MEKRHAQQPTKIATRKLTSKQPAKKQKVSSCQEDQNGLRERRSRHQPAESTRKRNRGNDEEDTGSEKEGSGSETHRKTHVARPGSFQMSVEETDISSMHDGHSVTDTNTADQDRWRMTEERLRCMEEIRVKEGGGVSVVSAASTAPPADERISKENLRKFVAAKVFPSWKFILRNQRTS
jgi:hypothetical protein